jgi:hypothetical protein
LRGYFPAQSKLFLYVNLIELRTIRLLADWELLGQALMCLPLLQQLDLQGSLASAH